MNVIEAIQRKKHEAQELHLVERQEAKEVRDQSISQKQSDTALRLAAGQERRRLQKLHREETLSKTIELFHRSGLSEGLQRVEQRYLTRFAKHELITHFEIGEAMLIWGKKYNKHMVGGRWDIDYENKLTKGWLRVWDGSVSEIDCCLIYIHLNPRSGSIKMSGSEKLNKKAQPPNLGFRHEQQNLRQSEWSGNLDLVSEALATAFLYPVRLKNKIVVKPNIPPPSPGGTTGAQYTM